MTVLRKPTYYLWRNDFSSRQEFETAREQYINIGFRVVAFLDGPADADIHTGIRAFLKNHRNRESP